MLWCWCASSFKPIPCVLCIARVPSFWFVLDFCFACSVRYRVDLDAVARVARLPKGWCQFSRSIWILVIPVHGSTTLVANDYPSPFRYLPSESLMRPHRFRHILCGAGYTGNGQAAQAADRCAVDGVFTREWLKWVSTPNPGTVEDEQALLARLNQNLHPPTPILLDPSCTAAAAPASDRCPLAPPLPSPLFSPPSLNALPSTSPSLLFS